jgi:hypothetical protein
LLGLADCTEFDLIRKDAENEEACMYLPLFQAGKSTMKYRNACGERVLNLTRELDLRAPSTFFDSHGNIDTWRCPKKIHTR